jgi:biotin carboxyl carrier protein
MFSFCLEDGALLSASYDPNATLVLPAAQNPELPLTEIIFAEEELKVIILPRLGDTVAEVSLAKWNVKVGDRVEQGEYLFAVSTEKVNAEIPSPYSGIIAQIIVVEGETVPVETVVAKIKPFDVDKKLSGCTSPLADF